MRKLELIGYFVFAVFIIILFTTFMTLVNESQLESEIINKEIDSNEVRKDTNLIEVTKTFNKEDSTSEQNDNQNIYVVVIKITVTILLVTVIWLYILHYLSSKRSFKPNKIPNNYIFFLISNFFFLIGFLISLFSLVLILIFFGSDIYNWNTFRDEFSISSTLLGLFLTLTIITSSEMGDIKNRHLSSKVNKEIRDKLDSLLFHHNIPIKDDYDIPTTRKSSFLYKIIVVIILFLFFKMFLPVKDYMYFVLTVSYIVIPCFFIKICYKEKKKVN